MNFLQFPEENYYNRLDASPDHMDNITKSLVEWIDANSDNEQTTKKAIGELVAQLAEIRSSNDVLRWLANYAILELESLDASSSLREVLANAKAAYFESAD